MKNDDVKVGGPYTAKISDRLVSASGSADARRSRSCRGQRRPAVPKPRCCPCPRCQQDSTRGTPPRTLAGWKTRFGDKSKPPHGR